MGKPKFNITKTQEKICVVRNALQLPKGVLEMIAKERKVSQHTLEEALKAMDEADEIMKNFFE